MSKLTKALTAAAGNAGGDNLYVEDVFSTYLYEGNGTARTITNGIDIAGEGGLVWTKARTSSIGAGHILGTPDAAYVLKTESTGYNWSSLASMYTAFNSDGYAITDNNHVNENTKDFASWTFRKAEKFFDVQTWTGNGATQNISHNLGSTPAVIIVKGTTTNNSWCVYSSALGNTKTLFLDLTSGEITNTSIWNSTTPTDSVFSVGNVNNVNESGQTFVAYLFASDAGGFGDDGSESIIKCGSYTGAGSEGSPEVTLGWEPQWLLIKNASSGSTNWVLVDSMRGLPVGSDSEVLYANTSGSASGFRVAELTATGFKLGQNISYINQSGDTYIYIAIRRPMKTPESGTEVFKPTLYTGTSSPQTLTGFGFPADIVINKNRSSTTSTGSFLTSRLTGGGNHLRTNTTQAELTGFGSISFDEQDGITLPALLNMNGSGTTYVDYAFKRATGFFDVVAYTPSGVTGAAVKHNLGVAPELAISKVRDSTGNWLVAPIVYGDGQRMFLNSVNASSSGFTTGKPATATEVYQNHQVGSYPTTPYIAYLFATLAGVSKVGSYTGTGSDLNVDCGFSAGARFILIKRTDSTGDWYVYDSARGIVAGNDPYLLLNSTAAEVTNTDYIDPLSSGFTVTSSAPAALNASGGTYIFLAIA